MSEEKAPGYHLTKPEARQLMALARERERVQAEMEEIGEAFGEMAGRLAAKGGLPEPGEGRVPSFEDAPDGGIVLRIVGNSAEPGGEEG